MGQYFDYTETVSNGYITSINYFDTKINSYFEDLQYLNVYQIDHRPSCISVSDFIKLIVNNSLKAEEQTLIKTDAEGDAVFIFTELLSLAEKLDSVANLLMKGLYYENMIKSRVAEFECYQQQEINNILTNPFDIYYQGERIGQLEWIDHANYCYANYQLVESINSFNRYFVETSNPEAGFNVGVILSQINLDQQAINYYKQVIELGYNCHHNLALAYFKLTNYNLAFEHLEQVDFTQSDKSHLLKAQILIMQGQYNQALAVLNNGFKRLKNVNQLEANRIKKVFISLNNYLN